MSSPPFAPRRALLLIDVQNEYFAGGNLPIEHPPTSTSLPRITEAMDAAHAAGVPVIVVQHTAGPGAPVFDPTTERWQLHPEVARRPADHRIEKRLASAFSGTDLADWLAAHAIDTLTVAGYMTHNCDAATIYEAAQRGLAVEFLHDASGALPYANAAGQASAQEIHRVYGVVFQSGFAAVVATSDWIAALRSGSRLARDNVYASNQRARQAR